MLDFLIELSASRSCDNVLCIATLQKQSPQAGFDPNELESQNKCASLKLLCRFEVSTSAFRQDTHVSQPHQEAGPSRPPFKGRDGRVCIEKPSTSPYIQ